jgi:hypothetical protein
MNNILRMAFSATLVLGVGSVTNGCIIGDCTDAEGNKKDNCVTLSPAKGYTGTDVVQTLQYTDGLDIVITQENGDVDVEHGTTAGEIQVTFSPFTADEDSPEGEAEAKRAMENDLVMTATDDGRIEISVGRVSGASGFLGAHIEVKLPASFSSHVSIESSNGSVAAELDNGTPLSTTVHVDNGSMQIAGAAGQLDIVQGNGTECDVRVAAWAPAGEDGVITCSWNEAFITLPSGAEGSIQVTAGENIVDPDPLPADWVPSDENTATAKSFSFGTDPAAGANVVISGDDAFGEVFLDVQ